ncbi:MAG: hypothetical protein FWE25_02280 [Lachnospiraceae bacterium]|nr:hypothetical protein [Lachnospiraceae bacterium]
MKKRCKSFLLGTLAMMLVIAGSLAFPSTVQAAFNTTVRVNALIFPNNLQNQARGQINTGALIAVTRESNGVIRIVNSRVHIRLRATNNTWPRDSAWWIGHTTVRW